MEHTTIITAFCIVVAWSCIITGLCLVHKAYLHTEKIFGTQLCSCEHGRTYNLKVKKAICTRVWCQRLWNVSESGIKQHYLTLTDKSGGQLTPSTHAFAVYIVHASVCVCVCLISVRPILTGRDDLRQSSAVRWECSGRPGSWWWWWGWQVKGKPQRWALRTVPATAATPAYYQTPRRSSSCHASRSDPTLHHTIRQPLSLR